MVSAVPPRDSSPPRRPAFRSKGRLGIVWEKHWPEIRAIVGLGLPQFILSPSPDELGTSVPVFSYHVVNAARFEADLDFIARNGYVTIDADTMLAHLTGGPRAPERAIVLTFDDGPDNFATVAFPLLRAYGMTAVAFIAPELHADPGTGDDAGAPIDWARVRALHDSGLVDFQSHTFSHRYVPRWPQPVGMEGSDPDVVERRRGPARDLAADLAAARESIEQRLGKVVRHLAFPQYLGTDDSITIGREVGYEGFWWGPVPRRRGNRPGQSPTRVVRVDGRFLRRLPGGGRMPLRAVLAERLGSRHARTSATAAGIEEQDGARPIARDDR